MNKWNLPKEQRFKELKKLIIPAPFTVLRDYGKSWNSYPELSNFPSIWVTDLHRLSDFYGCDFAFRKSDSVSFGGQYSSLNDRPIIYVTKYLNERTGDYFLSTEDLVITFSHELSHRIQHVYYSKHPKNKLSKDKIAYEKEAERLSYFVYKEYFQHRIQIKRSEFYLGYSSTEKKKHLLEYHKKWYSEFHKFQKKHPNLGESELNKQFYQYFMERF
jgi:hypothetical protein